MLGLVFLFIKKEDVGVSSPGPKKRCWSKMVKFYVCMSKQKHEDREGVYELGSNPS
ncbi:hypothetical protein HS088_TW09G00535 [Tripterygium wilfordii]|uniref:Uncharacterized protein n=1 Tax=Tripterygium wilfordii TaxID=458696 RepID=A0A7J7D8U8_TRIWF|nr:hypothetical protein HS088_TW09G00535 [Tripterygium wilfordii]